ncbi:ABC transporter ATP-binding protein [Clostridium sp. B9]|uniref:ABC transporter ATP-binding protein n=1 Tax=Clostridium sp. B9 TaxID=3423224 RepID=UPI003D2EC079
MKCKNLFTVGELAKNMNNKLKVSNLKKSYGNSLVLNEISFEVTEGSIFALLGTNGAGKTTTLECIEGIKSYDSGSISINGKLGVQLQNSSLHNNLKCIEALHLFSRWNNTILDKSLIESFELTKLLNKEYKELSTGQKRRLHLALALVGNPDIIILDEPTAGLDVESRISLHETIRKLKSQGKTLIIASHDMAEVEALCDKIAILKDGNIIFNGSPLDLTTTLNKLHKIKIFLNSPLSPKYLLHSKYLGLNQNYYCFETNNIHEALIELLSLIKEENLILKDMQIEQASLEECFINITRGEDNE